MCPVGRSCSQAQRDEFAAYDKVKRVDVNSISAVFQSKDSFHDFLLIIFLRFEHSLVLFLFWMSVLASGIIMPLMLHDFSICRSIKFERNWWQSLGKHSLMMALFLPLVSQQYSWAGTSIYSATLRLSQKNEYYCYSYAMSLLFFLRWANKHRCVSRELGQTLLPQSCGKGQLQKYSFLWWQDKSSE